jgi:hypothetical protein
MEQIEDLKKQRSFIRAAMQRLDDVAFLGESNLQGSVDGAHAKLSLICDAINDRIVEIAQEEKLDVFEVIG